MTQIKAMLKWRTGAEFGRNDPCGQFRTARRMMSGGSKVVAVLTVICVLWSCGKKGPPEPPSGKKPPSVKDLGYSISATTIKLSWTVPPTTAKAKSPVAGFLIYRNQESLGLEECPNCPIVFQQVGDVPSPRAEALDRPLIYTQELQTGYRYIFKVRAYDDDGLAGRDSNLVQFNF